MERYDFASEADIPPELQELLKEMGDDGKSLEEKIATLNERLQYLDSQDDTVNAVMDMEAGIF